MQRYVKVINRTYEQVQQAFAETYMDSFVQTLRDGYTAESSSFDHGIWVTATGSKEMIQAAQIQLWLNEIVPGGEAAILVAS